MAVPKVGVKLIKVMPPFKSISNELVLLEDCSNLDAELKMNVTDLDGGDFDEEFKIRVTNTVINLILEFFDIYKELASCVEIAEPIFKYLELIPMNSYPITVRKNHKKLKDSLTELKNNRNLVYVKMAERRPKALRLYEPKIVEM